MKEILISVAGKNKQHKVSIIPVNKINMYAPTKKLMKTLNTLVLYIVFKYENSFTLHIQLFNLPICLGCRVPFYMILVFLSVFAFTPLSTDVR